MIPVAEKIEEISNLPGKEVYATIGDPRMVMKSLTKLYSNTAMATIREYSTNARDSNVQAGKADVPIKVTLPSLMHPYFVVQDCGVGLSQDELEEVYISYGISTKRESNDFNGMLGYGSKSALAYTNTFTVTSVKDGIRNIAVITRKPDYSVALRTVESKKVDEPNGVTISVPVQNWESFARIARDFYRFWKPGTVLVDGVEPDWAVGEKIDDDLYYSKAETSYVVMGNVAYRIANPAALFSKTNPVSFVAYVHNGSVEFTPSREDLEYSDATKKTLEGVISNFENKMYNLAKSEIEKATDHWDAYTRYMEWGNRLGHKLFGDIEFEGEKFESNFIIKGWVFETHRFGTRGSTYLIPSYNQTKPVSAMKKSFIVHSMNVSSIGTNHRVKVMDYLSLKGMSVDFVYFTNEEFKHHWIKPEKIISWEDLVAAVPKKKREKLPPGQGRIPGSFDYYDQDHKFYEQKEIPEKGKVWWISVQDNKKVQMYSLLSYLRKKHDFTGYIVVLPANRIDKFRRENSQVEGFYDFAWSKGNPNGESLLSDEAKLLMGIESNNYATFIKKIPADRIIDPEWKQAAGLLAKKDELMLDYLEQQKFWGYLGRAERFTFKAYSPTIQSLPFINRYPLLSTWRYSFPSGYLEDVILYMNAAYKARRKSNG